MKNTIYKALIAITLTVGMSSCVNNWLTSLLYVLECIK